MSFRGADSVAAVFNLVQSSQYAGCGLFSFSTPEEVEDMTNFFSMDHHSLLCVIKPHAVRSRLVGNILKDIVSRGFAVSAMETFCLERAAAAKFLEIYYVGISPDYNNMCSEMCSGTLVALEIRLDSKLGDGGSTIGRQEEVVETFRIHAGPWDVDVAKELYPDTIRARFGKDRTRNAIHCTDLPKDGVRECGYFFKTTRRG
jgi:nucleoside-diphosphate kinase